MDLFSVITLLGGLAFFLYGMHVLSSGLEKITGGKLQEILKGMTSSPLRSLALGAGITMAIQSSSALTVMLVGLVNSGLMTLRQSIGVIMGSNIGTTITAWIFSLAGIESSNTIVRLFKPENFSPIIALIGVFMLMASKSNKRKDIGSIFVGFAVLMYGMELMSGAVSPLADMPEFAELLVAFNNPILGVLVGTIFTAIIQSSSASVGILQAISLTGGISFGMAIPIIMGQNIGTCVTALISSIGVNKNAKRVSIVHISFNVIGSIIFLIAIYGVSLFINLPFMSDAIGPLGIAVCHSIFNIVTTVMLLPFTRQLEKIAYFVIKDDESQESYSFLDERLLNTPSFAISECNNMTVKMSKLAYDTVLSSMELIDNYDKSKAEKILADEDKIDTFEDKLGSFLVKLSSNELSDSDSRKISMLLHTIGDFERLGDHAANLVDTAEEMSNKKISFSEQAKSEIKVLTAALSEILTITSEAFENNDKTLALQVEPLEEVIDHLIARIKNNHIKRLQVGGCTIEMGFVLSDLLNNYERISDHCSNIAIAIIELDQMSFSPHRYLTELKTVEDSVFSVAYKEYQEKYSL